MSASNVPAGKLAETIQEFAELEPRERLEMLLDFAEGLPPLPLLEARPFIGRGARWLIERGFQAAGAALEDARAPELFDRFIARYRETVGLTHLICRMQWPGMPQEMVLASIERMGKIAATLPA